MGCCIFVAMIVAQVMETVRWVLGVFGAPVRTTVAAGPIMIASLRGFVARPIGKAFLVMVVSLEVGVLTGWVMTQHRAHVLEAVATVAHWVGVQTPSLDVMCRAARQAPSH